MSQETSRQTILVEPDGRGATITLNRTNALNALCDDRSDNGGS
jgi:enoyl-CoA hydratase/carnithine racemase